MYLECNAVVVCLPSWSVTREQSPGSTVALGHENKKSPFFFSHGFEENRGQTVFLGCFTPLNEVPYTKIGRSRPYSNRFSSGLEGR